MWEPIVVGDVAYRVGLRYVPGGGPGGTGTEEDTIRVDLLANDVDPESRLPRTSSLVRGLAPSFVLRSGEDVLGTGVLAPALTPLGAGYTASVPVSSAETTPSLDLSVSFDPAPLDPAHDEGPEHEDPCVGLPDSMQLATGIDLADLLSGVDLDGENATASNTFRMVLRSSLDPRPADNYSNIWGWNDGTTYLAIE